MRATKAIFKKEFKSTAANPESLMMFIIYPAVAFVMTMLLDMDALPEDMRMAMPNLTTMMAAIFAGLSLIPVVSVIIARDIEKKSLRFLMMAGVKPAAYLIGIGGVIFFISFLTSIAFAFIDGFSGAYFWIFTGTMMSGVTASIILGGIIGILTKSQQSAVAISTPLSMILAFGPMIAQFNEGIARGLRFVYTQQINVVANYLNAGITDNLWQSFIIMWANVSILAVIFIFAYARRGLKD
ncbi:MAG: hypothetical protein FWB71_00470 [Defluviitaleaceae bacterium]|nr:hypothetical protein [Defluviitaleaceae bacterium]